VYVKTEDYIRWCCKDDGVAAAAKDDDDDDDDDDNDNDGTKLHRQAPPAMAAVCRQHVHDLSVRHNCDPNLTPARFATVIHALKCDATKWQQSTRGEVRRRPKKATRAEQKHQAKPADGGSVETFVFMINASAQRIFAL
jgi:hypothetical protein